MGNEVRIIDDSLSIRNGRLYVEDRDAVELVGKFGSPIFVMSEKMLRSNIRRFKEAFEKNWPEGKVTVMPAIKANVTLSTRRILTQEGAGVDVYSPGELMAALNSGADPAVISVNGGGKDEEHIRNSIKSGCRLTLDDVDELDLVEKVANELNMKAKVRFRVRPDFPNLWRPTAFTLELVPIDLGTQAYKNGIPTEHVIELGKRVLKMKNVELVGFHLHTGRHHDTLWYWQGMMKQYVKLIATLKKEWGGYEPQEVSIGGGFPIPRDPFGRMMNRADAPLFMVFFPIMAFLRIFGDRARYKILSTIMQLILTRTPNKKLAPTIEDFAGAAMGSFRKAMLKHKLNMKGLHFQLEPGRSLYGNAGIHLSTVMKTKHQKKPIVWNWVLLDTTYFFLTGGTYEQHLHDFIVANKPDAKSVMTADIVGRSCYGDRMIPEVRVPELKSGDIIAILDTGAYQEVSASNFNALPRPATILVNGSSAEIIKRAETLEDVFSRDIVPERLKTAAKSSVAV
jgi:diaminopimelate decarboxylase